MWTTGTRIPSSWRPAPSVRSTRSRRCRLTCVRRRSWCSPRTAFPRRRRSATRIASSSKKPRGWSAMRSSVSRGSRRSSACVYQSRSGRPEDPWLGPDVSDYLTEARSRGLPAAVLCPIGFVCDHIEILFDLDVEAAAVCRSIGLPFARAAAVNDHPRFLSMMADMVLRTWTRYERGVPLRWVRP